MMPPGQLLPLTRPPPPPRAPPFLSSHRSRCPPPARAHARGSPPPLWRAHRLHDRFLLPARRFGAPARPPRAPPTPPGVSAAGGGEAQAAAVGEFVTSERVKVAAMLALALALCNADRVVMSVAIVPLSQAYGWTPSFAGVVQGYFVILSWMPVYFKTIYHVNLREAAWFSALPWVMMAVLGYVAGLVSDMLIRNGTNITLTRKIMQSIGFLGPGIALLGLNAAKSPIIASAWLTIAVGLKSFGHSGFLVNLQEIAPQHAGVLHGMSNTAGTFAAILGTVGAGFFVDRMGSFRGFLIKRNLEMYYLPLCRNTRGAIGIAQRLNIAIDIVHAIAYLHGYTDHPIIHRDIKSSNILLTEQLRAKVADFGFARLAHENPEATHVSTLVKGTAGYVDPEYLRTNQLTDRSDVYSFGVLLVELVTGRRPIERGRGRRHHQSLTTEWVNHAHPNQTSSSDTKMYAREVFDEITVLEQALRKCKEGDVVVVMDTRMRRTSAVVAAVEKVMALASECTAPERAARPAMRRCAEVLWSVRRDLQQEQQRVAAAAASAGARRHGGSTSAPPSATSLRQERVENLR
nr:unnamed protein product [Digitaria exilis]